MSGLTRGVRYESIHTRAAAPVARLASDPALEGVTGRYFHRFRRESASSAAGSNDLDAARLWNVAAEAFRLASDKS